MLDKKKVDRSKATIRSKIGGGGDRLENKDVQGYAFECFTILRHESVFPGFEGPLNIMIYNIKFVININQLIKLQEIRKEYVIESEYVLYFSNNKINETVSTIHTDRITYYELNFYILKKQIFIKNREKLGIIRYLFLEFKNWGARPPPPHLSICFRHS